MNAFRIHILYEYGKDLRPHSSAFIRLLRPLTHPVFSNKLQVSSSIEYDRQPVDAIIVDRLWRPYDISPTMAQELVSTIRSTGAKFIYTLDDNFLDLPAQQQTDLAQTKSWFTKEHLWIVKFWLREADTVIVTTLALKKRFQSYNSNIIVIPNMLDDRLLVRNHLTKYENLFGKHRLTIGYMGTLTHDDDLMMILPALQDISIRYPGRIELQLVGGISSPEILGALKDVTVRQLNPDPREIEYPLFMLWFTSQLNWDIAIAPLRDTSFNRGKSDLKFLDYSAIGAAGIYSQVKVYENTVRHEETGWLAENTTDAWIRALNELGTRPDTRKYLAENATRYLFENRMVSHYEQIWLEILSSTAK